MPRGLAPIVCAHAARVKDGARRSRSSPDDGRGRAGFEFDKQSLARGSLFTRRVLLAPGPFTIRDSSQSPPRLGRPLSEASGAGATLSKQRKRLIAIVSILVVAGGGVGGYYYWNRKPSVVVQTGHVERLEVLDAIVSASGEVRAKEFVDLQTEIAGVIVELPVKEGDRVKQGDVLLRIDPFQTRQDVASAQAQVDSATADSGTAQVQISTAEAAVARDEFAVAAAQSELVQSESNRDRLKSQLERKKGLLEKQVVSIDDFEAAESAVRVADSQVISAGARVEQAKAEREMARVAIDQWKKQHEAATARGAMARANLERMQDLFAKTTITSPLTGVITKLNVEKGERAVPGILSNPQATLMTIADLSTIEAEIKVDETDIINVSIDDQAKIGRASCRERV